MTDDVPESAEEWVLEEVEHRTEPEPDGVQNNESNVWTSRGRLRDDGRKHSVSYSTEEIDAAIAALEEAGEIVAWHGLLAPATDEHLRALVENEAQADTTRAILVGKCNRAREGATA